MNVASTKARIKNIANKNGKNFQDLLIAYGLERTIYRLSKSNYVDRFVLKGGIFLYAISDGNFTRATVDIDLSAQHISNDIEEIKRVFLSIFSIETGDALRYDLDSVEVKSITEFKEYHGVNVSVMVYLDRTRIPISIDIGFGDVIFPDKVEMEFPVLLGDEVPRVYAYSLISSIAEKFEAIVSLGYDNSRYKDFYDIYVFAHSHFFEGTLILEAFKETFHHRNTSIDRIVAFEPEFIEDPIRISRWKNFSKKKKTVLDVTLKEAVDFLKIFIGPLITAMRNNESFDFMWNPETESWEN